MRYIIASFILFLLIQNVFSQTQQYDITLMSEDGSIVQGIRCGTVDSGPANLSRGPENLVNWGKNNPDKVSSLITIPIAFHIITNTNGNGLIPDWQINAQIDTLNSSYSESGVVFYLYSVDTTANDTWYNVSGGPVEQAMKQALAVDPTHTLNIYTAAIGNNLLGWAFMPWSWPENHYMHGTVILNTSLPGGSGAPYNLGATITHEVGHYLGLHHTFRGGCVPPGDQVDDTPYEGSAAYGCPIGRDTCPADPGEDPIHNYMDYTNDACMYEFTPLQAVRVNWAVNTYKPGLLNTSVIPNPPSSFSAFSDYSMPNSMLLSWTDPGSLINGDSLFADTFQIMIEKDGILLDSSDGGIEQYMDFGLLDGQEYFYSIYTKLDSINLISPKIQVSWIAGGSPIPKPPVTFEISGGSDQLNLFWTNPNENIDGTTMDDFYAINLYQDDVLAATFSRTTADTGAVDSVQYSPAVSGLYYWYITAVDNENPANESEHSNTARTPLNTPIVDKFTSHGSPDPLIWNTSNAIIDDRADNPPSGPFSLNINATPIGGDVADLYPTDISGLLGTGLVFSYLYQPQGTGNEPPEENDSLQIFFKDEQDNWNLIKSYPGDTLYAFRQEIIDLDSLANIGQNYFLTNFQIRISSLGNAHPIWPRDEWFVDNIFLGEPAPVISVDSDTVLFDTTFVGYSDTLMLEVQNIGLQDFTVSNILSPGSTFIVNNTNFTLAPGTNEKVDLIFTPQTAGNFMAKLQIIHDIPGSDTVGVYAFGSSIPFSTILKSDQVPKVFSLSQNYPNPFNPETTVEFSLPKAVFVNLAVYNILGQKVATLVDNKLTAGVYTYKWNATDFASGVYYYKITAESDGGSGSFVQTRKLILMK